MKKTITIIGINYYPEDTAIGLYTSQLAEHFHDEGVNVNVVTGFPYYPAWKINQSYMSKKTFCTERINGVNIYRYKQYTPSKPTFFKRIIHLLDFTFGSLINIFKIKKTDIVLCIVPFTSLIFLGKVLSKLRKAKLWVHIQDFEFDAVSQSDLVHHKTNTSLGFKLLFWIEEKLLNSADIISTISLEMLKKSSIKTSQKKLKLLPNWVDLNSIDPKTSSCHKYLQSNKFKILYSGNIGEKQDWSFFLRFAKALKHQLNIEIIVVGDGSKKVWLHNEIAKLENVTFHFPVAYAELSDLLCSADLHILFQKEEVIDTVLPSKILAMMASEKPSLITGNINSEVATIISKSNGGRYFGSNTLTNVIDYVKELKENEDLGVKYGESARKYAFEHFSKEKILKQFNETITELID